MHVSGYFIIYSFKDITSEYSCTVTYSEGTASVSCVNSTSSVSGHQVILLQQNYPHRIVVFSDPSNVHVTTGSRYCVMILQEEDDELVYSEVRYSSELIDDRTTAETTTEFNSARSSIGCKYN